MYKIINYVPSHIILRMGAVTLSYNMSSISVCYDSITYSSMIYYHLTQICSKPG